MDKEQSTTHPPLVDQPPAALLKRLFQSGGKVPLSFEFFPPQTASRRDHLYEVTDRLAPVAAEGFSVTMGAGGATRTGTHETAVAITERCARPVTAHLTTLGMSKTEALSCADGLWSSGVDRILALRGDQPKDMTETPSGFEHACDLVKALSRQHPFEIAVAAYPEKHPDAADLDTDIDHLKEKIDAGASRAYCQFVLDPAAYGRFLEKCDRHGIHAPIVPGLMPLDDWKRMRSFAVANGTSVPAWLDQLFTIGETTPEIMPNLALAAMVEQARRLIAYGAPALHVYTMNRWPLSLTLARLLGH
ncbi:methylenetetrahydrofolate reductase [Sulfitobacter sp. SK012]|uniref:methylenetetrahydrofolate reductase n=1 Tax=Sulfitobacter sp. SK012 TaxID=1389005 RepID=UPI0013B47463|nr:methylenetetrahydrofolate reductase [Sulfitobacter sp. SK012]